MSLFERGMESALSWVAGYAIFEDRNIGEVVTVEKRRTIKERLFTLPWQPFKKFKHITQVVPTGELYLDHKKRAIYGHPADIDQLRRVVRSVT